MPFAVNAGCVSSTGGFAACVKHGPNPTTEACGFDATMTPWVCENTCTSSSSPNLSSPRCHALRDRTNTNTKRALRGGAEARRENIRKTQPAPNARWSGGTDGKNQRSNNGETHVFHFEEKVAERKLRRKTILRYIYRVVITRWSYPPPPAGAPRPFSTRLRRSRATGSGVS